MTVTGGGLVDEARTRRWLAHLTRPELLGDAHMRALLRAHGRAAPSSPVEAGRAGAALIAEAIEALASPPSPSGTPPLAHRVLRTCFVDGLKNRQAAARLGLSERQLTRERARAIALLAGQLVPPRATAAAGPPPLPHPFLERPRLRAALGSALVTHRHVAVEGPTGCGKSTLVAALAAASPAGVFWHRVAPGVTARLPAILFELGEHLAPEDPALAAYVRGALPRIDVALATRVALAALGTRPRLLVLDGPEDVAPGLVTFLTEVVDRLPSSAVVSTGSGGGAAARVGVPPLTCRETRVLLELAGAAPRDRDAAVLHSWTAGNVRLIAEAARWMAGDARGPLARALGRDAFLLGNLQGLMRTARRAA